MKITLYYLRRFHNGHTDDINFTADYSKSKDLDEYIQKGNIKAVSCWDKPGVPPPTVELQHIVISYPNSPGYRDIEDKLNKRVSA